VLTGALALMALAPPVAVAWLTSRMRALATRAEEAVRARDEVLAIVSHDLRSPLNTVSISSSLLLADPDPAEQGRQVHVIETLASSR
jgi:signal transduction histidine kinase